MPQDVKTFETKRTAYVGRYALQHIETGNLCHGGPLDSRNVLLYETADSAQQAADDYGFDVEPVLLVCAGETIKFLCRFYGRKVNAIGIFYDVETIVRALNKESVKLELYVTYEHIHRLTIEEIN